MTSEIVVQPSPEVFQTEMTNSRQNTTTPLKITMRLAAETARAVTLALARGDKLCTLIYGALRRSAFPFCILHNRASQ